MASRVVRWNRLNSLAAALLMHAAAWSGLSGDFNGDGLVDFADFVAFARHYGTSRSDGTFDGYDGGQVEGAFFGPAHEEVAGMFQNNVNRVMGSFGAVGQD